MPEARQSAYVTGGASGIGKAICQMLVEKGCNVFIADRDFAGAEAAAKQLNGIRQGCAAAAKLDVTDWSQQLSTFEKAIAQFPRIDYVFPIAGVGEKAWLPPSKKDSDDRSKDSTFTQPDLTVLDVDLKGVLYTVSLAVQYFRRQQAVSSSDFRGKILTVASVCGIYAVPTLPIYTSAKHGVLGFVRSYGKYLGDEEGIALNAVCPNVVRTHISSEEFYGVLEERALLTPMESVLGVFEGWLWGDDERASGQCVEVGPRGKRVLGPEAWAFMDRESEELCGDRGLLYQRSRRLQTGGQ